MSNPTQKTPPRPLFDTAEALLEDQSVFRAERPALVAYLAAFSNSVAVEVDLRHARSFLKSYSASPSTFKNYRGYLERLILWSWIIKGKSVLDLVRTDAEDFLAFDKSPPAAWVGAAATRRFTPKEGLLAFNERWRPYGVKVTKADRMRANEHDVKPVAKKQRSAGSEQLMYSVCCSFFDFLLQDGVDIANPFKSIKRVKETRLKRRPKALTKLQWDFLAGEAEAMADEDPKHERTLFIVVALFAMYLRVSDLAGRDNWQPTMGSFDKRGDSWWFDVIGKGNKERDITVKDDFIPYLKRYRESLGLSPLPHKGEDTPLLYTVHGRSGVTARQIRNIVQPVFDRARARMKAEGHTEEDCKELMEVSLHWLRHTGATFDADIRDPKHLQMDLGHESLSTTQDIYYNAINEERAASNRGSIRGR
ncbi:tyrosine-type recombinase/integrase [Pseudomonas mosselii]|uniref:tyrosine-type recombinase/integrase n=1 Tax=Pseudomonas mosselii TaxID=78327 RepID=UPI0021DACFE5|nr:site-specific integrase [Pseudomonas mosselii]MCU9528322.1 site-specific integrase [Pseudomonas mosselii]MCU9535495.1 site-specific integrase [Pseudomonas mosselii]MCU9543445.1 site-specific integrase [Pseudomonas mosselii]MCU9547346.1 site-specific integrase [Pseudomonas mosselii]